MSIILLCLDPSILIREKNWSLVPFWSRIPPPSGLLTLTPLMTTHRSSSFDPYWNPVSPPPAKRNTNNQKISATRSTSSTSTFKFNPHDTKTNLTPCTYRESSPKAKISYPSLNRNVTKNQQETTALRKTIPVLLQVPGLITPKILMWGHIWRVTHY